MATATEQPSTKMTKKALRDLRRSQLAFHAHELTADTWSVPSDSQEGKDHTVNIHTGACTCQATSACWHWGAALSRRQEIEDKKRAELDRFIGEYGIDWVLASVRVRARTRAPHQDDISSTMGYSSYFDTAAAS